MNLARALASVALVFAAVQAMGLGHLKIAVTALICAVLVI